MSAFISTVNKINFTFTQLISSSLFLGYSVSHRNSYINYFLLGERFGINLFNLNFSYFAIKKFIFVLQHVLSNKGRVWIINENFQLFPIISTALMLYSRNLFQIKKWPKGLLTNRRSIISNLKFPHILFITNSFQNSYIANESTLLGIPTAGLVDSSENPLNYTFPIPSNSKSLNSIYFFYLLIYRLVKISRFAQCKLFRNTTEIYDVKSQANLWMYKYLSRFNLLN